MIWCSRRMSGAATSSRLCPPAHTGTIGFMRSLPGVLHMMLALGLTTGTVGMGLGACASAGATGDDDDVVVRPDAEGTRPDADPGQPDGTPVDAAPIDAMPIDAMPIDAPPQPVAITLSQGTNTIVSGNAVGCSNNITGYTTENSYYRLFNLPQMGYTGQVTLTSVSFGVESASHSSGSQTVQVKLYTVNGAFTTGNMTLLYGQNVTVANTNLGIVPVTLQQPVVVPAGAQLAIEVFVPDGTSTSTTFFIGSNTDAESAPSYIRAPGCSVSQPSTFGALAFPDVHIVLTASGTTP